VEYVVTVHTGTALGAGTDGDVFLALTGERGSTEERQLTGSSTHANMFERGELPSCGHILCDVSAAVVDL
jgi:hypothetical protein